MNNPDTTRGKGVRIMAKTVLKEYIVHCGNYRCFGMVAISPQKAINIFHGAYLKDIMRTKGFNKTHITKVALIGKARRKGITP